MFFLIKDGAVTEQDVSTCNDSDDSLADVSPEVDILPQISWDNIKWTGPEFPDEQVQEAVHWYLEEELPKTWWFPGNLTDFINNMAPYYFNMMPYYSFKYQNIRFPDKNLSFLNNLFCYAGRDNDLLVRLYKRLRPLIFNIIDTKLSKKLELDEYLVLLNATRHKFIDDNQEWHESMLDRFYDHLICQAENIKMCYIEDFFSDYGYQLDDSETFSYFYTEYQAFWGYSFWARRYREGNLHAATLILNDLLERYSYENDKGVELFPETVLTGIELSKDEDGNSIYAYNLMSPQKQVTYKYDTEGCRTGEWLESWSYEDEISSYRWQMENGVADGILEIYLRNEFTGSFVYRNGVLEGKSVLMHPAQHNKRIPLENSFRIYSEWKDNKKNGEETVILETGITLSYANYVDDEMHGDYKIFHLSSGKLLVWSIYEMGELVSVEEYNEEREVIKSEQYN